MPEISKEEARKRLEDSVKNIDWIAHFLGDETKQQNFLDVYRGLHAQLREGDRLEIHVYLKHHIGKISVISTVDVIPTVDFGIALHTKKGEEKEVYRRDFSFKSVSSKVLYKD